MISKYNQEPKQIIKHSIRNIYSFNIEKENIDPSVVHSFGEEWKKFHKFSEEEIEKAGKMYFDIINDSMVNKNTYGIDIGCGTGRWTKYLSSRIGFMEAIDPSEAIFSANKLLGDIDNVRLSIASTDNIPFNDNTFDFAMSIGVLHHIPNTQLAMSDCVKKVKIGGHFYTYLYYNLDNRGPVFKAILSLVNPIRKIISVLPSFIKKTICDLIAILFYMPFVLLGRLLTGIGLHNLASKLPLSLYQNQSFFVIRNDALDRFGTSLEQRFSKAEIIKMMENAGLGNIVVSENLPYWHAVGKRIQ